MQVDNTAMSDKNNKCRLMKELVNLHKTTEVSVNMKDIKEIVGIPTGTNEAGGYLAASSIIYDIREKYHLFAAIECPQVFTMCNAHDNPIEFYLNQLENGGDISALEFYEFCNGKWQGGLSSSLSRMLNSDLTPPMDADTLKLYKKERTQPMGNILINSVQCETTVTIMKKAALASGLTMKERMDLLTSGECVGIPMDCRSRVDTCMPLQRKETDLGIMG
jgi:hypothetical protein